MFLFIHSCWFSVQDLIGFKDRKSYFVHIFEWTKRKTRTVENIFLCIAYTFIKMFYLEFRNFYVFRHKSLCFWNKINNISDATRCFEDKFKVHKIRYNFLHWPVTLLLSTILYSTNFFSFFVVCRWLKFTPFYVYFCFS